MLYILFICPALSAQITDIHSDQIIDSNQLRINDFKQSIINSAKAGDYQSATGFQAALISLNDSIIEAKKEKAISKLRASIETKKAENEISLANTLSETQSAQLEKEKLQRFIYFSGGFSLVIILLGMISRLNYLRITRNESKEKSYKISFEKQRAEESEKVREKFLAKMSHEIRTPMNAIMGMTNILKKNNHLPEQIRYLDAIWQSSENLLVILNDILDLSQLEAGKIKIEQVHFRPMDELMKLREILKYKAHEKGIELNCELDGAIPEKLIGDPIRLNQILINLTGNAIKFTEQGNVFVSIQLKDIIDKVATIKVTIRDTGIGIQEDRLEKIFESFIQAESDTTRRFGGTGLGLTISKELVQLQNGKISVESKPGKGSTFRFEIPYQISDVDESEKTDTVPATKKTDSHELQGLHVLLVEDNEFNIMVAKDELNEIIKNVKIDFAENGKIAVEKVRKSAFDIVLMDIEMKEMNGYEATKAIRKLPGPNSHVPIIAITANAMKQDIEKCFEAGMDDHLSKPFESQELELKIKKLLRYFVT